MPAIMINPNVQPLQPQPLPNTLVLLDGRTAQGDLDQSVGIKAGWLILVYAAPVSGGFVRMSSSWVNNGDGTAIQTVQDITQADYDAQQEAIQSTTQNAAVAATQANLAATLPTRQAIAIYMQTYIAATQQLCTLAGIPPVNLFALGQAETVINGIITATGATAETIGIANGCATELVECERKLIDLGSTLDAIPAYPGTVQIPTT